MHVWRCEGYPGTKFQSIHLSISVYIGPPTQARIGIISLLCKVFRELKSYEPHTADLKVILDQPNRRMRRISPGLRLVKLDYRGFNNRTKQLWRSTAKQKILTRIILR